jgi:hypothetical protein
MKGEERGATTGTMPKWEVLATNKAVWTKLHQQLRVRGA